MKEIYLAVTGYTHIPRNSCGYIIIYVLLYKVKYVCGYLFVCFVFFVCFINCFVTFPSRNKNVAEVRFCRDLKPFSQEGYHELSELIYISGQIFSVYYGS